LPATTNIWSDRASASRRVRRQSTGLTFRDDPDRDAFGFWAVESTLAVSYRAGLAIGRAGLFTLTGRWAASA